MTDYSCVDFAVRNRMHVYEMTFIGKKGGCAFFLGNAKVTIWVTFEVAYNRANNVLQVIFRNWEERNISASSSIRNASWQAPSRNGGGMPSRRKC